MSQEKIEYGQIINIRCNRIDPISNWTGPLMGIAIVSGDEYDEVPCTVEKYWEDDEEPKYKVKLVPMIQGYATTNIYVMDLESMLFNGSAKIRLRL